MQQDILANTITKGKRYVKKPLAPGVVVFVICHTPLILLIFLEQLQQIQWYEENGLEIEAFRHAVKANDMDRIIRILQGHVQSNHRMQPLQKPQHFLQGE